MITNNDIIDRSENLVILELFEYYCKQYDILKNESIIMEDGEKESLIKKIANGLKKIWKAIARWTDKIVHKIRSVKNKKTIDQFKNLDDSDLTKIQNELTNVLENQKIKQEAFIEPSISSKSFQNIDDIDHDIKELEVKRNVYISSLIGSTTGKAFLNFEPGVVSYMGQPGLYPIISVGDMYAMSMLVISIIDLMKLKKKKHDLFSQMVEKGTLTRALEKTDYIFKKFINKKNNLSSVEDLYENGIKDINTSKEEQVFKQINYFYNTDIKNRNFFKKQNQKNINKISERDKNTIYSCVCFTQAWDAKLDQCLINVKNDGNDVSDLLTDNFGNYINKDFLLDKVLKLSKLTLETVINIYSIQEIGLSMIRTIEGLHEFIKTHGKELSKKNERVK